MKYEDNPRATNKELKRIQDYLRTKGIHATKSMVVDVAIAVTKRLGGGDYTFYSELAK